MIVCWNTLDLQNGQGAKSGTKLHLNILSEKWLSLHSVIALESYG